MIIDVLVEIIQYIGESVINLMMLNKDFNQTICNLTVD